MPNARSAASASVWGVAVAACGLAWGRRRRAACLQPQMEAQQAAHEQASAAAAKLRPMPGNELLEYLKCLTPEELVSLTDCASEDVIDAMNLFVQRLMGELC